MEAHAYFDNPAISLSSVLNIVFLENNAILFLI